MSNFYIDVIKKDHDYKSLVPVTRINLLEPVFRQRVLSLLEDCNDHGIDVRPGETYRSQWLQHKYWLEHKSQLAHVGTHGYGLAIDVKLFKNGIYQTNGSDYEFLVAFAHRHKIISGYDWGHGLPYRGWQDFDHLQAIPVDKQPELFAGDFYPEGNNFDPYQMIA